ncbi:MAG: carboxylating nicotinate-nucleotide diphosphorylase [Gammaproteobacteria bacterium]
MSLEMLNPIDHMILELGLLEDLGQQQQDVTSLLLLDQSMLGSAVFRSKHPQAVIICGLHCVEYLLRRLDAETTFHFSMQDGQWAAPDAEILQVSAQASVLLKAERLALNLLRHLSAIATLTARYVAAVAHTQLKILDTRKTTPGLRHLEKYAVACGGGVNHRHGLYDAVMVKDTHVDLVGTMTDVLARLPENPAIKTIVEVRNLTELETVLQLGRHKVHQVLLDNMSLEDLRQAVSACRGYYQTEASGNIRLHNIVEIAETGVDYASVGELTYGAGQVDLSMYTYVK